MPTRTRKSTQANLLAITGQLVSVYFKANSILCSFKGALMANLVTYLFYFETAPSIISQPCQCFTSRVYISNIIRQKNVNFITIIRQTY